jgi:hypothetical protein
MNGRLGLRKGTTFFIRLPVSNLELAENQAAA